MFSELLYFKMSTEDSIRVLFPDQKTIGKTKFFNDAGYEDVTMEELINDMYFGFIEYINGQPGDDDVADFYNRVVDKFTNNCLVQFTDEDQKLFNRWKRDAIRILTKNVVPDGIDAMLNDWKYRALLELFNSKHMLIAIGG